MIENYYHILGLDNFATREEVKQAYRRLAKKYHPDRNPGKVDYEEKFKRLSKAYSVLSNIEKKREFDQKLSYQIKPAITYAPQYAPRSTSYTTEKQEFTPKAWMYGKLFIIIFTMTIVLIPLALLYWSSVRYYERGVIEYGKGNLEEALTNYTGAITQFGGRSAEAGLKASEICYYDLEDYEQTLFYANKGLEYANKDQDIALLHFLKGMALSHLQQGDNARHEFMMADSLNYSKDSIYLKLGVLHTFELSDFFNGEAYFDSLIQRSIESETIWFGKAWCQQNKNQYKRAIKSYTKVVEIDSVHALAHYYRGASYLSIKDSLSACQDLKKAFHLGLHHAERNFNYFCVPDTAGH